MDELQRRRLAAASKDLSDAFASSLDAGVETASRTGHLIVRELIALGFPEDPVGLAVPMSMANMCVLALRSVGVDLEGASAILDRSMTSSLDDPYWFDSMFLVDNVPVRMSRRIEQAMRALRGVYAEIVDIIVESHPEFHGCAPDGVVTPKLEAIFNDGRAKAKAVVRFLVEFFYSTLPGPPTSSCA